MQKFFRDRLLAAGIGGPRRTEIEHAAGGGECVGVNEIFNVFASGGGGGWILECLKLVELVAWGRLFDVPNLSWSWIGISIL